MLTVPSVVEEIEAKWGRSLQQIARQVGAGDKVCEHAQRVASRFTHKERLALAFAARGMHALRCVELLFSTGHPQDAASVMRTLVELYIDYRWIAHVDQEARIRMFVDYCYVSAVRRERAREKAFGPPDPKQLEQAFAKLDRNLLPSGVNTAQDLVDWVRRQYENVEGNYPNKSSWSQQQIAQRAREIGEENLYALVHRAGSEASHVTPTAMASLTRGETTGLFGVEYEPLVPVDAFVLVNASHCFYLGFHYFIRGMSLEADPEIVALGSDLGPHQTGWEPSTR